MYNEYAPYAFRDEIDKAAIEVEIFEKKKQQSGLQNDENVAVGYCLNGLDEHHGANGRGAEEQAQCRRNPFQIDFLVGDESTDIVEQDEVYQGVAVPVSINRNRRNGYLGVSECGNAVIGDCREYGK